MNNPVHFSTTHRPNFQEIDSYGHLNTIHYLNYFLSHRFIAMRERFNLDYKAIEALEIAFYSKSISLEFIRSVRGDNLFTIDSYVLEKDEGSAKVQCDMFDDRNRILARCQILLVCISKTSGKPCHWPAGFIDKFYE